MSSAGLNPIAGSSWTGSTISPSSYNRIKVNLVYLPSEKASLSAVTEALQSGTFDIFHFAGHGSHSELDPDDSGILLWSPSAAGKQKAWLGVNQLHELLRKAKVRLAYLNCCRGSETASQEKLWNHSFLGIAHGVAMAGVSAVLGFRSQISDPAALKLCQEFYIALAEEAQPDVALYLARRQTKAAMPKDSGWLSPVLIDQS